MEVKAKGRRLCTSIVALLMVFILNQINPIHGDVNWNQFLSPRQLYPLRAYKDVQIFRYQIPHEVTAAHWRLNATVGETVVPVSSNLKSMYTYYYTLTKAYAGVKTSSSSCESVDITYHLRWGSIPIININNASFPENFLFDDSHQHTIRLRSDSKLVSFDIKNPLSGDWYALAYLNHVDDRISQKGLRKECYHKITSSLALEKVSDKIDDQIIIIAPSVKLEQNITKAQNYKFYTSANYYSAKLNVIQIDTIPERRANHCPIVIYIRSSALADDQTYDIAVNCSESYRQQNTCIVNGIVPAGDAWTYVRIEPTQVGPNTGIDAVEYALTIEMDNFERCDDDKLISEIVEASAFSNTINSMPISSSSYRSESFAPSSSASRSYSSHKYSSIQRNPMPLQMYKENDDIELCPNYVKLTRYDSAGAFEFKYMHNDATSMDGNQTLSIFFDVPNDRISYLIFDIIPQADIGGTLTIDLAISPFTNITHNNVSVTLCLYHGQIGNKQKCFIELNANTSDSDFSQGAAIKSVMIPYPRPGIWYITLKSRCYHSEYETIEGEEIVNLNCLSNKTSILLDVTSAPCSQGKCGDHGKCYQYLSGGILFSSCACRGGWKGWFCNDGSEAVPNDKLLLNFLLLTLSNIMFIPAVILATYRRHFTEALVYLTTMTSSAFYHACDSDYPQSFCVLNINVLSFGDFYSAILAFWITLVTLANIPDACRTFFHILGGIVIAFAVEIDRTSLWAFAGPASVGGFILLIGWACNCCCRKECFPTGKMWLLSILPGLILTALGLVIYAFLQTQENYAITHSSWHATMALALLFLIPTMKRKTEDEDSGKVSMQNAKLAHVEWRPSHTSFKFLQDDIDML